MIYFAFRKIGFVDEVIYCKLIAVMSHAQMEIALRFDGILGTANGLCEHFSFTVTGKQNKMHFPGSPSTPPPVPCALLNPGQTPRPPRRLLTLL
jgi:hypothetical protein